MRLDGNIELQDKMVNMMNRGWNGKQIAKNLGVSEPTVGKWRKRFEASGSVAARRVVDDESGRETKVLASQDDVMQIVSDRIQSKLTPTHEIAPLANTYSKLAGWDSKDPSAILEPKDEEEFLEWMVEILLESPRKVAQQIIERFEKECRLAEVMHTALTREKKAG